MATSSILGAIPGHPPRSLPGVDYSTDLQSAGEAAQKKWVTKSLPEGMYVGTFGLTACTGFALCDPDARIGSLAHFDASGSSADIQAMLSEMRSMGAQDARIRVIIAGYPAFNMTALGVYDSLLKAAPHLKKSLTVYQGRDQLLLFGDGRVGYFND